MCLLCINRDIRTAALTACHDLFAVIKIDLLRDRSLVFMLHLGCLSPFTTLNLLLNQFVNDTCQLIVIPASYFTHAQTSMRDLQDPFCHHPLHTFAVGSVTVCR